ncbi:MAG: hypothetical protein M3008_08145 [Chloroflexota bacterium]|nr:hypothetical protein [Chloroflexota bacterium]
MYCRLRLTPMPLAAFALLIVLAGCGDAVSPTAQSASLSPPTAPAATRAPEAARNAVPTLGITDPTKWYNTTPLTLEALRGKPVFLVFWSDI